VGGLTDGEYLERRAWHFEKILPGHPKPRDYRIERTNVHKIHSRCVEKMRVGRILLAADAAHVCNPMGGYGRMVAVSTLEAWQTV
jgi:2-polyprenyl-6-methoxyphenol hydroxylase-like FAD-dependent oxidoreductase